MWTKIFSQTVDRSVGVCTTSKMAIAMTINILNVYYLSIDSDTTHISTTSLPGAHTGTHSKIVFIAKLLFIEKV